MSSLPCLHPVQASDAARCIDRPEGSDSPRPPSKKADLTEEQIQKDIQAIMRNITSTVAFLPALRDKCAFTILAYTDKDTEVPTEWMDSDPHGIKGNAEQVGRCAMARSTGVH